MWKKFVTDYLTFSKKDRNGILVLTGLIAITLLSPLAFPYLKKKKKPDEAKTQETIKQLRAIFKDTSDASSYPVGSNMTSEPEDLHLFYFDPNTISMDQWQQLGVHKTVAETIQKYLSKGGRFKRPEDLKKIYTLHHQDAERLIPYVRIKISELQEPPKSKTVLFSEAPVNTKPAFPKKHYDIIDINKADTSSWIALPGIGGKLANRIINFRDKLGGFCSVEQVGETRFLPDSTFQKIKPFLTLNTTDTRKMDINFADINELRSHPYINYNIANAIVQYRNQNGKYKSLDDLLKVHIIDDALLTRIRPYLEVK